MTEVVERNSTTLADLSWQAKSVSQAMNLLAASGTEAANGSQTLSENSLRVSQQATQVGALARQAEENSRQGQQELQETVDSMRTMGAHTQEVNTSIIRLQDSSRKIENIAQLIREIADKINLLSLNAAIEAARAGEHGRGFAVVAQEVNKLAEKTFNATQEIDASIGGILGETDHAVQSINVLLSDVQNNVKHIDQVGERLNGILEFSSVLTQHMDGIVHASEQSAREVQGISGYLGDIRNELLSFGQRIQSQESQIVGLTELGEGFFDNLIELRFETVHHRMYQVARTAADQIQQLLESAVAQGKIRREDLLSGDYQPIPNTNPAKFSSRFDVFCDHVLPPIQEQVLKDNPQLIFAICTDTRGYVPTHNDKFAKAPTGDYATDLVNSRSKRIFNDRTGSRCGAHTKKMLLQTYKRDTGEIMHDLSVPIYLGGTHWGGFRMGYQAHEGSST
jgi:methyl-accepting chemotaxis protein